MENKFFRLKKIKAQVRLFAPVLFLVISLALIGFGVSKNPFLVRVKTLIMEAATPVVYAITAPVRWLGNGWDEVRSIGHLRAENERLKAENIELLRWKNTAMKLAADKQDMERLINYVPEQNVTYLTARVMAENGGTFARSLVVQAGTDNGVKKGAVALTPVGLLGRIVETGTKVSRLLLLTDYTSRIPVMVGQQRILCILSGDNTDYPKLISLPEGAKVSEGDLVMTSGHAGVFPSGLEVGKVVSVDGTDIAIELTSNSYRSEFIRLVDFGLTGILPDDKCECPQND